MALFVTREDVFGYRSEWSRVKHPIVPVRANSDILRYVLDIFYGLDSIFGPRISIKAYACFKSKMPGW